MRAIQRFVAFSSAHGNPSAARIAVIGPVCKLGSTRARSDRQCQRVVLLGLHYLSMFCRLRGIKRGHLAARCGGVTWNMLVQERLEFRMNDLPKSAGA